MIASRLINEDRSDIPWRTDGCDTDEQRDILIIEIAALAYLMDRAGLAANGKTGHPSESGRTTGTRHAIKHLKQILNGDPDNQIATKEWKRIKKIEKKSGSEVDLGGRGWPVRPSSR